MVTAWPDVRNTTGVERSRESRRYINYLASPLVTLLAAIGCCVPHDESAKNKIRIVLIRLIKSSLEKTMLPSMFFKLEFSEKFRVTQRWTITASLLYASMNEQKHYSWEPRSFFSLSFFSLFPKNSFHVHRGFCIVSSKVWMR